MPMVMHDFDRPDSHELQRHCHQCSSARGRLHWLRCTVESIETFLAPRLISLLVVLGVLVLIGLSLPLGR